MPTNPPPTPLPTTNATASTVAETVGGLIEDQEKPVEAAIIAAEPEMATPVLLQVWESALHFVFMTMGNVLGKLSGYVVIDIQAYAALQNAASALSALRAAQLSGDSNAVTQANTAADAAAAAAIHYVGSINT